MYNYLITGKLYSHPFKNLHRFKIHIIQKIKQSGRDSDDFGIGLILHFDKFPPKKYLVY